MYNPQLDTFIHAANSGSFSEAADELHISPTAIIKQINLLESDLNLKLIDRTHRGITLTEAGKSLYKDAKYLIQYSKDFLVRARNAMQSNENIIRIGTSLMKPTQFLMELWPKIHEHCPELKFVNIKYNTR